MGFSTICAKPFGFCTSHPPKGWRPLDSHSPHASPGEPGVGGPITAVLPPNRETGNHVALKLTRPPFDKSRFSYIIVAIANAATGTARKQKPQSEPEYGASPEVRVLGNPLRAAGSKASVGPAGPRPVQREQRERMQCANLGGTASVFVPRWDEGLLFLGRNAHV